MEQPHWKTICLLWSSSFDAFGHYHDIFPAAPAMLDAIHGLPDHMDSQAANGPLIQRDGQIRRRVFKQIERAPLIFKFDAQLAIFYLPTHFDFIISRLVKSVFEDVREVFFDCELNFVQIAGRNAGLARKRVQFIMEVLDFRLIV